jgi:hypothetical protein
MAQTRKTPKYIIEMMECQQDYVKHVEETLEAKKRIAEENLHDWVKSPDELFIGRVEGMNIMLEDAMLKAKCYAGYMNVSKLKTNPDGSRYRERVGVTNPEYAEWRRTYFTQ